MMHRLLCIESFFLQYDAENKILIIQCIKKILKLHNIQFNAHIEMHIIRFITEKAYSTMLQIQYVEYMMNIYR